jgi:uncharacterized membrane protein
MLSTILNTLVYVGLGAVAIAHVAFAYKEIFSWVPSAVDVLGMSQGDALASAKIGQNQGLSNAFLAAGAVWAMLDWWLRGSSAGRPPGLFFGTCALIAGVFGYETFRKKGFLIKQALPGLFALTAIICHHFFSPA